MPGILNAELAIPQFPALDQYGPNTTLLLHGDGTNGAQNNTFIDSSANNFTITRNGNTTQGTFSPFSQPNGYWSNYFNGSSALILSNNAAFNFGSGAFTIEAWVYFTSSADLQAVVSNYGNSTTGFVVQTYNNRWYINLSGDGGDIIGSTPLAVGQWTHVAVSGSSGSIKLFINGTQDGSTYTGAVSLDTSASLTIGNLYTASAYYNPFYGYISNLRLLKGTALYTSNFTPPTSPLTSITNTSLLTCQSNRFVDNSANAFSISVGTGTPSVQPFHPISAPTNYYPAVNGGGAYFDGSGDYLNVAYGSGQMNLTNQDFAIEFWAYIPVDLQNKSLLCQNQSYYQLNFFIDSSVNLIIYSYQSLSSGGALNFTLNLGRVPQGQWAYFTLTRTGSTVAGYINGVRAATASFSGTITAQTGGWNIGAGYSAGGPITGYMSDVRFTIGSNPYGVGTTISIPTAPLTAITNTQFLLSCTNAGIIDSVSQNIFETVGNAQVSTTQSKFGGASMYFDGSSYLSSRINQNFTFGSAGDFTIELWLYQTSSPSNNYQLVNNIIDFNSNYVNCWGLYCNSSNYLIFYDSNGAAAITSSLAIVNNVWTHITICRSGGSLITMYINGNSVGSYSGANQAFTKNGSLGVGGAGGISSYRLNGYIDDLRITNGIARYTKNFTPPQNAYPNYGPLTNIPTVDPQFNNTTLLLHGNGTNGAQNNTFLDSSTNNFTITRNGNTTQGTFTPFSQPNGWWSNYFDGGGTSYLFISSNSAFNLNTYACLECWVNFASVTSGGASALIIGREYNYWLAYDYNSIGGASGKFVFTIFNGSSWSAVSSNTTPVAGAWYHIAAVKDASTLRIYINGTQENTASLSGSPANTSYGISIGSLLGSQGPYKGYVSNGRLVTGASSGVLPYTSNFTPPTMPLTAVSGTSLLTCQSNRFLDNSTNAFTVTPSGSPSAQNFYPFFPPLDYSTAAIGGSGYFDGAGDFLNTPTSGQFTAAGDFTVSCWFYLRSFAASYYAAGGNWSAGTSDEWLIQIQNNGAIRFLTSADGTFSSAGVVKLNQWTYFTATRSGTTVTVQVNGTTVRTYTKSDTLGSATKSINIGQQPGNNWPWNGYIADFRLVSGSAVTTIPTAPATAISGTSLLLSCTNGSLIDNASKYNVETVATAQISTAQSKFGGSSILLSAAGDYLLATPAQVNPLGTGNFTVEYWIYFNSVANQQAALVYGSGSGNYEPLFGWVDSVGLHLYLSSTGSSWDIASAVQIIPNGLAATGRWYHVAVTRSGSTFRTFCNGNQVSTFTSSAAIYQSTSNINVGRYATGYWINAYFDDIRITNGVSRYNSNFTPPIAQFPNK